MGRVGFLPGRNSFLPDHGKKQGRKGKNRTDHHARLKITDKYIDSQPGWLYQKGTVFFLTMGEKTSNKVAEYPLFPSRKGVEPLDLI